LIFRQVILHIPAVKTHCSGQTRRKAGTQSHRSKDRSLDHDSGVARMYNTNLSVLRPTLVVNELGMVAGRC